MNRSGQPRPAIALQLAPRGATLVHYVRVAPDTVEAYELTRDQHDHLAPGKRPPGSALIETIRHTHSQLSADAIVALLGQPLLGTNLGHPPCESTVRDLARLSNTHEDPETVAAPPPKLHKLAILGVGFVRFHQALNAVGAGWALETTEAALTEGGVRFRLRNLDNVAASVWIAPRENGRDAFLSTNSLSFGHDELPAEVSSFEFGEIIRALAAQLEPTI